MISRRDLEIGVALGLACAAGLAGECTELTSAQLAVLLDRFSANDGAVRTIAAHAVAHAELNRELEPHDFRDLLAALMRQTKGKG